MLLDWWKFLLVKTPMPQKDVALRFSILARSVVFKQGDEQFGGQVVDVILQDVNFDSHRLSIHLRSRTTATVCFSIPPRKDTKKTWSPARSLASHSEAFPRALRSRNEQHRKPHAKCIYNIQLYQKLAFGIQVHQWPSAVKHRNVYITHLRGIHCCFVLDYESEKWKVSECQNQSVVNAFSYMSAALPCNLRGGTGQSDGTKIRINYEL